jgi:hypothetical protein
VSSIIFQIKGGKKNTHTNKQKLVTKRYERCFVKIRKTHSLSVSFKYSYFHGTDPQRKHFSTTLFYPRHASSNWPVTVTLVEYESPLLINELRFLQIPAIFLYVVRMSPLQGFILKQTKCHGHCNLDILQMRFIGMINVWNLNCILLYNKTSISNKNINCCAYLILTRKFALF